MRFSIECDKKEEVGMLGAFPKGRYAFEVTDLKDRKTQSGFPMVILTLTIAKGEHAGRKMWHNVTFFPKGEKGHGFTLRAMHALGLPFDGKVNVDTNRIMGATFEAEVDIEEYEWDGKMREKNVITNFIIDDSRQTSKSGKTDDMEEVPF